jgi:hypothetical protein
MLKMAGSVVKPFVEDWVVGSPADQFPVFTLARTESDKNSAVAAMSKNLKYILVFFELRVWRLVVASG